jgi:hypothetical protein
MFNTAAPHRKPRHPVVSRADRGADTGAWHDGDLLASEHMTEPLAARLSWPTRLGYGIGIAPETWKSSGWDLFILFFYTQVLGVPGTLTGAAIAAALVVDAVTDPMVGV